MRVAGTRVDATRSSSAFGLETAIREWIGSTTAGQLGYFRSRTRMRHSQKQLTDLLGFACLGASAAVVALFLFAGSRIPEEWRDPLMLSLGLLLLLFAVRHSYAGSIAEKELIKQYEFMHRIFHNAKRRIDATDDDDEKRRILRILGDAALGEHAQWILMHRERSLEQGEIFRMSG